MKLEMKNSKTWFKKTQGKPTSRMDQVEDRASRLKDKVQPLSQSVKED